MDWWQNDIVLNQFPGRFRAQLFRTFLVRDNYADTGEMH